VVAAEIGLETRNGDFDPLRRAKPRKLSDAVLATMSRLDWFGQVSSTWNRIVISLKLHLPR